MNPHGPRGPYYDPHGSSPGGRRRPSAEETYGNVDKLHVMAHEMANLIDGSMRCLQLAWSVLPDEAAAVTLTQLDTAKRQVETVRGALERMTDVLRTAMGGTVGRRFGALDNTMSLAEALFHAVDVVRGSAAEHRVKIEITISADIGETPAAAVYPAVLNGLYNAVESIAARGGSGTVELIATRRADDAVVEIIDDGVGLDPACTEGRAFAYGCSTKDHGDGLGLAICKSVLDDLGGTAQLMTRHPEQVERRGAVLRLRFPAKARIDQFNDWVGEPKRDEGER